MSDEITSSADEIVATHRPHAVSTDTVEPVASAAEPMLFASDMSRMQYHVAKIPSAATMNSSQPRRLAGEQREQAERR